MGSFMDALKHFVGMSSTQARSESDAVTNPDSLLPYAKKISLLLNFKEVGDELEQVLSGPGVNKQSLVDALQKGQRFCDEQKEHLNTVGQYPQYANLVKEMLALSAPATVVDHNNFTESNFTLTLQTIVKHYNILEKLFTMVPFSDNASKQFQELTKMLTASTTEYQTFFPILTPFKQKEAKLAADITNFGEQISKIKSQNPFSTDYGGKQAELTKIHAELTKQREEYVKEEEALNKAITSFAQVLSQTHAQFAAMLQQLLSEINETLEGLLSLNQEVEVFLQNRNSILEAIDRTENKVG